MTDTVRINGRDVPIDELDGPDPEQQTAAYRRFHRDQRDQRDRASGRSLQCGVGNSLPHRGMKHPMILAGKRVG